MNMTTATMGSYQTNSQIAPAEPAGVLETELGANANCIQMLAIGLDALENKMRNILRPSVPPAPAGNGSNLAQAASTPSPMVEEVQKQRSHIDALSAQVQRLIERLEA